MGSLQRVVALESIPDGAGPVKLRLGLGLAHLHFLPLGLVNEQLPGLEMQIDRKSTRLNSSH